MSSTAKKYVFAGYASSSIASDRLCKSIATEKIGKNRTITL
ncbi:hypothetical protein [Nostoc sp. 2RC]|nr:hypothetical protein [Nostoc sp. 2RC]